MLHPQGPPRPPDNDEDDAARGRLVFYEYCISLVFITLRRPSRLYRVPVGSWGLLPGLPYTLVTLLLGWWGIPWGFVYTPLVLWTNCSGGREVTLDETHHYVVPEVVTAEPRA